MASGEEVASGSPLTPEMDRRNPKTDNGRMERADLVRCPA